MKNLKKKRKSGFTLIELIVVIAILGILAAIAVPRLGAFRGTADTAAIDAATRTVESAAAMYHANTGTWPANVDQLVPTYLDAKPFVSNPVLNTAGSEGKVTGAVQLYR